ncbi:chromosomal replication initiator DnaA [Sinorhizobium meliloti]|uniref:helix-turn-helix domain-containing protein n=1 Tax=Rhizobium meliloti TaxID=382 RepID=UPI000FD30661|nr:helix-turn-helix domain-containing protein [Sinorhizobium meliloti]RVL48471.1 chromosomal replication initiator DnaA [Sinorhizobium meliloti]RVL72404.1 chromosomal replication initiator DnaA [Sinorhizobium meliloti]
MQAQPELMRQQREWREARARLTRPAKVVVQEKSVIDTLKAELADAAARIRERDRKIAILELDVADRDARILSQAEMISHLQDDAPEITEEKRPVSAIIGEVLDLFPDVTWSEVAGVRREKRLIRPRQLCMYELSRQRPDLSLPRLGRIFNRDHTTVLYSVQKIRAEKEQA